MITRDPYGISRPPIRPGRLPEPLRHVETGDTPENMERCLHCTEEDCNGACRKTQEERDQRDKINRLAEIIYYGGTDRFAMKRLGLTVDQIRQYEKTAEYRRRMEKLRNKRRGIVQPFKRRKGSL